jgi:hypothetical protein
MLCLCLIPKIIHGDVKIDNVLLRADMDQDWSVCEYQGGGKDVVGAWGNVGIELIDWVSTIVIDHRAFPST